jgi:hypothetical protein
LRQPKALYAQKTSSIAATLGTMRAIRAADRDSAPALCYEASGPLRSGSLVWQEFWSSMTMRRCALPLRQCCASLGTKSCSRRTRSDGIAAAENGTIDVALIDMNMPGLDGLEAVKAIARIEPRIPVIGMSGGFDHDERR